MLSLGNRTAMLLLQLLLRVIRQAQLRLAHVLDLNRGGAVDFDLVVVATGGFLTHYNPPYADIYMEVDEAHRRRGYGSYLIQELKRVCYETGRIPAARCDVSNAGSRSTLEKAGLLPCARLLTGVLTGV